MYQSDTTHEALLKPEQYTTSSWAQRDQQLLLSRTWQLLAIEPLVAEAGDQVVRNRFGRSVLLRNHDGQLAAMNNVCAHRACEMFPEGAGFSSELKCPYHGWRYGADGLTRKLPGANYFPKFDRQRHSLETYRIKKIGRLLFVFMGPDPSDAIDDFGAWESHFVDRMVTEQWRFIFHDRIDYPCDWKIAIEGSLEGYHLSEVHPQSLGAEPAEDSIDHQLLPNGTLFETRCRESSWLTKLEERGIRYLSGAFDPLYQHFHLFPNVMASMTDTLTLVYQIFPTGQETSAIEFYGFSRYPAKASVFQHAVAKLIALGSERIARRVLQEDADIFPYVQRGIRAAADGNPHRGRLFGRCEERLHAFHQFWMGHCETAQRESE